MRSPNVRMLAIERKLIELAELAACGHLPRHEAAESLHGLADELAATRAALVDWQTRTIRNNSHTDYRRNYDALC